FTSQQEAHVSERFGVETRDLVLPLGVVLPEFTDSEASAKRQVRSQYNIPEDSPIVLFMSRIDPKKGLDLLLPALTDLLQADTKFHFILSGGNPQDQRYVDGINQHIQQLGLGACTTVTGFVSGELKGQILQAADIFVLPSYYENFGIAVAEAMMAGKPVVISDQVHIWPDIKESESGWVTGCDRNQLIQALTKALSDPAERQRRGAQGQQFAATHYSWAAISARMLSTYQDLLA
ncbi:MAG: glycosyltransferase, partial [Moorea sp. SIO3C2]|nr:glycosyltransferase [Moorena sp. SIO3C2]